LFLPEVECAGYHCREWSLGCLSDDSPRDEEENGRDHAPIFRLLASLLMNALCDRVHLT